jgi:hypothetical protein
VNYYARRVVVGLDLRPSGVTKTHWLPWLTAANCRHASRTPQMVHRGARAELPSSQRSFRVHVICPATNVRSMAI